MWEHGRERKLAPLFASDQIGRRPYIRRQKAFMRGNYSD